MYALAIAAARAREQRCFLLGLADNGAGGVLTLAATVLAIIALCSPTDSRAYIGRQWAKRSGSHWHACDAELLGELTRTVCRERAGQEIAHLGGLGPEQHGQRGRVIAVAGQGRLEFVDGA